MSNPTWQDVRRLADDVELQIHLASMDVRDRWQELRKRVDAMKSKIERAEGKLDDELHQDLAELRAAVLHVRDDIYVRPRRDFLHGW